MLVIVRRLYVEAGMDSARSDGGGGGGVSIESWLWFGLRPLTKCIITRGSYGQCSGEPANTTPGRGQRPS